MTATTDYSLQKTIRKLNRPILAQPPILKSYNTWARSDNEKTDAFAKHIHTLFIPNPNEGNGNIMEVVIEFFNQNHLIDHHINKFTAREIYMARLNQHKTPGYDPITAKMLRKLPAADITFSIQLFNTILRREFVPSQQKVAQIIMVPKPGKNTNDVKSYRSISLLPITSKVTEILFLKRLMPIIETNKLIPAHHFGFSQKHGTIEQIHRLIEKINYSSEKKKILRCGLSRYFPSV